MQRDGQPDRRVLLPGDVAEALDDGFVAERTKAERLRPL